MAVRGFIHHYRALLRHRGPRETLRRFRANLLFRHVFPRAERRGVHVLPVHYYSPVPDTTELVREQGRWYRPWDFARVDHDRDRERELLVRLGPYLTEELPPQADVAARGLGEGFGDVEAPLYHAMLRHLRPRQVMEVGAGVSTYYAMRAIGRNHDEDGHRTQLTLIEPYPTRPLHRLVQGAPEGCDVRLVPSVVQEVPEHVFAELQAGDVLFIDSSHVVRPGSDVNHLFLRVIPTLRPGVHVHVHDVHFPYPTAALDDSLYPIPLFRSEPALLYALLIDNPRLRVTLATHQLHVDAPEVLGAHVPTYDPAARPPSSVWLETRAP